MQTEVILPLVAYLLLVFGLSVYAYRRRQNGNFLSEYFLGNRSMGGFVLAMTLTATYISASSFIGAWRRLQIWPGLGAAGDDPTAGGVAVARRAGQEIRHPGAALQRHYSQ